MVNFLCAWDLTAITIFVFSMIVTTEIIKRPVKKFLNLKRKTKLLSLFISWIVGFVCFHLVYIYLDIPIEKIAYMQFFALTILSNGGYGIMKQVITKIVKLKKINE